MLMSDPLQDALQQNRPFATLDQRTIVAMMRAASVLHELMQPFFRRYGLTHQQYNVLRILRGAGPEGLPSLEVANRMVQRVPDITRILVRLEKSEMLTRERADHDRRIVRACITESAQSLLSEIDQPLLDHCRDVCAVFNEEDQVGYNRLLDLFCNR